MYWGGCRKNSGCTLLFGAVRITGADIADNAVIFTETNEFLAEAFDSLSEEAEPLSF